MENEEFKKELDEYRNSKEEDEDNLLFDDDYTHDQKVLIALAVMAKAKEMVDKSGQMGVPVVEIDGQMIIGFDKERICQIV